MTPIPSIRCRRSPARRGAVWLEPIRRPEGRLPAPTQPAARPDPVVPEALADPAVLALRTECEGLRRNRLRLLKLG